LDAHLAWTYQQRPGCASGRSIRRSGLGLLYRKNGLHITPNGFISAAHSDADITQLIEIHKAAMEELSAGRVVVAFALRFLVRSGGYGCAGRR
jgi:hypothetical protein